MILIVTFQIKERILKCNAKERNQLTTKVVFAVSWIYTHQCKYI